MWSQRFPGYSESRDGRRWVHSTVSQIAARHPDVPGTVWDPLFAPRSSVDWHAEARFLTLRGYSAVPCNPASRA